MPPHLYERVDKWTYEHLSIFNHNKHLLLDFTCIYIFCINYSKKNLFTFCNYNENPKTSLLSALVYIIALVYLLAF
jgi:hypothetical protein